MAVICLGASIAPLDFSVNVAFPAMTQAFDLSTQSIRWVAVCYMLSYGGLMLSFGSIGDRVGHLKVFRLGLVLGVLAFLLCAVAPTFRLLLIGRVVQGVATALTLSCAPALVLKLFHDSRRTWALSLYGAYFAVAAALAPVIGGVMTGAYGWPGVYWFRVPIVLLALICLRFIHLPNQTNEPQPRPSGDYAVWPILSRVTIENNNFLWINVSSFVIQWTVFAVPLMVPYYMVRTLGWSFTQCGVLLGIWATGTVVGSFFAPRLVRFVRIPSMAFWSAWVTMFGVGSIAFWSPDGSLAAMVTSLLVCGLGLGVYQVAYADLVVAALPAHSKGVAGSLTQFTRTIGVIAGAFTWLWIFQQVAQTVGEHGPDGTGSFILGYRAIFIISPAIAAVFLIGSSFKQGLWFKKDPSAHSD